MHILIVGSRGQLGNELLTCLKNGASRIGAIREELVDAEITAVDIDQLDITDADEVNSYFEVNSFTTCINCAAMTNVDGCEKDPVSAYRANAVGCRNLAVACEAHDCELIHVSTDYVFSGSEREPRCEWDSCDPQCVYGKSKLLGEQYVRDFCSQYYIVRTSWLYGAVGGNFVRTICKLAEVRDTISVVNDQIGNPTNANDLAHHILKLVGTGLFGVYHCTGNGECSWYDFASRIAEKAGLSVTVKPCTSLEYPSPTKRPAYSSLRCLALEASVGDEMRDWQTALDDFIAENIIAK